VSKNVGEDSGGTPVGRRIALGMLGLGALGVVFGRQAASVVNRTVGALPGVSGALPGAGGFQIYSVVEGQPKWDAKTYRLTVDGLVSHPMSLSLTDIAALPQTHMTKDFHCVTGWVVNQVPWSGVLLSDLLRMSQPKPEALALKFSSFDGVYTETLTLPQAHRPDMLITTHMYGKPLAQEHGAPVRLIAAPMYGYKSIKWLNHIEVVTETAEGYWEDDGYPVDAWIGGTSA
jgi:DMSO/TMAO reductase YedYZ molybdopterin-dependent catalytic subunit